MSKNVLITMRPADYYFFGGESTFDQSNGERNYLVRSNRLPQQTGVVGLLRHCLFEAGLDAGEESFDPSISVLAGQTPNHQTFGLLEGISPLFLQYKKDGTRHFLLPAASCYLEDKTELKVDPSEEASWGYSGDTDFQALPSLTYSNKNKQKVTYSEKDRLGDFWINLSTKELVPSAWEKGNNGAEDQPDEGIFISSLHIGIDKMRRIQMGNGQNTGNNLEAFYKQEFYRLAKGFQFACIATVDDNLDCSVFNRCMPFGGENRTFILTATPWDETLQQLWNPAQAYGEEKGKVVLYGDAFLENPQDLFAHCSLVVAKTKPFRNIYVKGKPGTVGNQVYANLHKHKQKKLLYLLERGSILYLKQGEEEAAIQLLQSAGNYVNIGYNHFHTHSDHLK
ncbi:MAG: hypothetical protein KBG02_07600 [Haliscomenobacter sp.]|nr:hypothetical protein [Haliscomenobacter sp.]